ncbi:putative fungal-specific transcription factor [Cadophora sp. MPI-SDFR-AT-0126]|nr:putative fungal-specific transcription factor [Leotiomycetes sp. MPI-SDFR-AT-0126]
MSKVMSLKSPATSVARRKRLKIGIACQACRAKKTKCDGMRPACSNCQKKDQGRQLCIYSSGASDVVSSSSQVPPLTGSRDDEDCSLNQDPNSVDSVVTKQPRAPESYFGGSPRVFAGEVSAAVHARFGAPICGGPGLSPMTDAPLFGSFNYRQHSDHEHEVDNVLPPRRHADHLMNIYWRRLHPLEPIVNEAHFLQLYQAIFAGSLPDGEDERTFLATVNTIFALATQLEETLQPEQREKASGTYFHRAWSLLRPEVVIWEPGSLAIVECLLLMSRFLQCTNNPHRTWMVVGSAVRIAQSLGLHRRDAASSAVPELHAHRRERLWQCCVFVDRAIYWAQGRIPYLIPSDSYLHSELPHDDDYFTKVLEIYDISNHITLSQVPSSGASEARLGLSVLYNKDDYYSTVMRFESCIDRWQKGLSRSLAPVFEAVNEDTPLIRQRTMLHLRLLHARIVLFLPLLARFCLSPNRESQDEPGSRLKVGLERDGGALCIQAAQDTTAVVVACTQSEIAGILPWWHRIFYLHIAGTILVAAMLREDLWTFAAKQCWESTMSAFHAMEHLNPFVKHCVEHFQMLSCKVLETHQSSTDVQVDGIYFQDIFRDIGFDQDSCCFGKEDMSWLGNMETS